LIIFLACSRHLSSSALFSCSNSAIGYCILGKGQIGHSKVATYYKFTAGSLHEMLAIELPWYPFSKPITVSLETSWILCDYEYFKIATVSAASLAWVDVPSFKWTYVIPAGATGIKFCLSKST
jgi:hypothetical protein